jgi:two-component system, chemotaxis family, protein-glutamate methylesterase/glutaminase
MLRMAIRVLIANSSGIARELIRNHLECIGCDVIAEAETASQTINLFRTVRPQLVALDLGLKPSGALDALAVFRAIRREEPDAAVMMMGAKSEDERRSFLLGEGALDCLAEPFDSAGFERMWRSLSDRYPELKPTGVPANLQASRGGRGHRCG